MGRDRMVVRSTRTGDAFRAVVMRTDCPDGGSRAGATSPRLRRLGGPIELGAIEVGVEAAVA
jgi:hypothetical protein